MPEYTRRQYLASAGAAFATAVGVSSPAGATDLDAIDEEFSHVEIAFEHDTLDRYQPQLDMSPDTLQRFRHLVSYVARSEEYDTYACCYIARYSMQDGIAGADSHLGDTEPVYIFVDEATDEPVEAVWSGWHWNAAGITAERATFHEDRATVPSHLSLSVVEPWGNYQYQDEDVGGFVELENWFNKREFLVTDGLYDRGSTAAFEEPWVMSADHDAKPGWWDESGMIELGIPPSLNSDYLTMWVWELLGMGGWDERSERLRG